MASHAAATLARAQRAQRLAGIYPILNDDARVLELARAVLEAGVRIVQYRAKNGIVAERLGSLRRLTRERDALLILNDDWFAAQRFDCDGVHLGPGDPGFRDVAPVRAALPHHLIGLSCGTLEEARDAGAQEVDYIGVGSVYATASKADAGEPIGLDGLRRIARSTALPIAAVGGITAATLGEVRRSGVAMAAVVSAIAGAAVPAAAARELVSLWENAPR
jgi:thiamine-phosphate pyrophosphorylase